MFSQKLLLSMVEAGVAREDAYKVVQRISQRALDEDLELRDLAAAEPAVSDRIRPDELAKIFDYTHYVRHVDETFDRAGLH